MLYLAATHLRVEAPRQVEAHRRGNDQIIYIKNSNIHQQY